MMPRHKPPRPWGSLAAAACLWVALGACQRAERERALSDIEEARRSLARLAALKEGALEAHAIELAATALSEAERSVRGESPRRFRPVVARALDRTRIADWVVTTQLEQRRVATEERVTAARRSFETYRRPDELAHHPSVRARVRIAARAVADAESAFADGNFGLAEERAREALELTSELPLEARALMARLGDPDNRRTWRAWVERAIANARRDGNAALVVDKQARSAMLWRGGAPPTFYTVELGYNGLSRKLYAGDGATPEGFYRVTRKKGRGQTRYYKALLLSYPNEHDRLRFEQAQADGRLADDARIGGLIEIHGDGGRGLNWTDGCVALENSDMDAVFAALDVGSPVVIVGRYDLEKARRDVGAIASHE